MMLALLTWAVWVLVRLVACGGEDPLSLQVDVEKLGVPIGGRVCVQHKRPEVTHEKVCTEVRANAPLEFHVNKALLGIHDSFFVEGLSEANVVVASTTLAVEARQEHKKHPCAFRLVSPAYGETIINLEMRMELIGCKVPEHGVVGLYINEKLSLLESSVDVELRDGEWVSHLSGTAWEMFSGTHQLRAVFFPRNGVEESFSDGSDTKSVFNLISNEILMSHAAGRATYSSPIEILQSRIHRPCRVAFFGNYKLDGQKTIWTNVLSKMLSRKDLFQVSFIFFMNEKREKPFLRLLQRLGIPYSAAPLLLRTMKGHTKSTLELLQEVIDALRLLVSSHVLPFRPNTCSWRVDSTLTEQCSRLVSELVSLVVPSTGYRMALDVIGELAGLDVLVYGNSKLLSDVLIQACAELAGVTLTVVDIPNHDPAKGLRPAVFVAPSWFSHDHPSIQAIHGVHKVVIYPGIDFNHFRFTSARKRSVDETVAIGFLARLAPEKLPGLFLDLVERLASRNPTTKFRFVMAGSGILEADLRALALAKRLSIEFLGHVPYDDVPALLESLDFTVHLRFDETFCLSNVESMAMGVPVIGFGSAAVSEYSIHGVNSWIATKPTLDSLVEAAETAIRERTNETPARCAASVQQFSSHRMAEAYSHLILDMSGFLHRRFVEIAIDPRFLQVPIGGKVCVQHKSQRAIYDKSCATIPAADRFTVQLERSLLGPEDYVLIETMDNVYRMEAQVLQGNPQEAWKEMKRAMQQRPCWLQFLSPQHGDTVVQQDGRELEIELKLMGCRIPHDGIVELLFNNETISRMEQADATVGKDGALFSHIHLSARGLFLGTHLVKARFVASTQQSSEASVLFNLVGPSILQSSRRDWRVGSHSSSDCQIHEQRPIRPYRLAFWGNYEMDGQKTIWLYLLQHFRDNSDTFQAEFLFFLPERSDMTFVQRLVQLGINYETCPVTLLQVGDGASVETVLHTVIETLRILQNKSSLLLGKPARTCSVSRTLQRSPVCSRIISELIALAVDPSSVQAVLDIVGMLEGLDVIVFGNSDIVTDRLIQACADFVSVPLTVMEVPNHRRAVRLLLPTLVITPSWFSHDHPSIQAIHGVHKVVIYPGIDFNHFRFTSARKQSVDETVAIGFLARLAPEKLPGLFLDLVERLVSRNPTTKFRFVMAGSGILEADLRALALAKRLSVEFLGHVPYDDVPALLESLDFTVHLRFDETFCLSNVESMAMGVPVIGFGSAAVSEYSIHGVNSWIATKPTLDSLVEATETAIRERTNETPARCAASVQQFSSHRMADEYSCIFTSFL